jgi:hypothetical protein
MYHYPFGGIFLTMLCFFLFFIWIWLLIKVFMDIFRSHDLGGFSKALWCIFVIVVPFLGVLVYLIARGGKMHERNMGQVVGGKQSLDSVATELSQLSYLKDKGVLSDAEFEAQKAKLLSS